MPNPSSTIADGIWKLNQVRDALVGGEYPLQIYSVEYLVIAAGGSG